MSAGAAAPLPPPGPRPANAMNGYPHGAHVARGSDGAGGPGGAYPSLAEISAKASEKVDEVRQYTIGRLLEAGKYHFAQAKAQLDNRAPAGAYWEFLVAYAIVVDVLPSHREYYDRIDQSRGQMHRDFQQLVKDVRSSEPRFVSVKNIILNENKRRGTAQMSPYPSNPPQSPRSSNGVSTRPQDELMFPSVPTSAPTLSADVDSSRKKPPVQPKPQSLHGRAVHQSVSSVSGGTTSDLADRFAKLRGAAAPLDTASRASTDLSVKMPSPSDYAGRPLGPRDMRPSSNAPPFPPKLPLDTQFAASLPKEPSPTYSPARNLILPANINPPRSTARSMVGTGGRSNSLAASSASTHAPNTNGQTDGYFPVQAGLPQPPSSSRRKSINQPAELQITAEKLYDYIRMYNVLLIDVRSRAEFDAGHIYVRSIMCVEPAALQDGGSAEQLQDRLVISPDEEQLMYERRNEFDLVVYYDATTKTHSFLQKTFNATEKELALKRLFDALYEFNLEKPLKRPPIFLMGGVDAWADLVGTQALKMSSTASLVASGQTRPRGPRKAAVDRTRLPFDNRRKREYRPMDQEEQQQWLEEARKGRSVVEQPYDDEEGDEAVSPMYRTTDEFLRRFPDIEQQESMVHPPSRPPPTVPYVAPAIPQAPSRPAPSVPRVSYSGVHERQLARQSSGTQPSLYISPGRHGLAPLHRTGLLNFGVTCYMNSVIQCLSANGALTSLFLTGRYAQDLQKNNFKGTQGILPEAYATLLSNLYKGDTGAIRPSTFRKVCGHFRRDWVVDQQQDAKEFLEFVLDFLHEDLNTAWDKQPLKELTDADELARERLPRQYAARIEWNRYLHRDNSLIGNLFAGQHASKLTCATCGTTSTKYEAFWSISVEIPHDRACDVRDCLRSYCSAERLDTEDSWRCPRCKAPREATKKITITRAPDTLVLHFKRFSASHSESARKVRTPVYFPLQGLDMGPFMEPAITPEQEAYVMANARDSAAQLTGLKTDPAMNGPYMYNAYAVIWHLGNTIGSGHYVAFLKDKAKGCWRSFNDERVSDFEPANQAEKDRLQNEKAYVVFYERERVAGGI